MSFKTKIRHGNVSLRQWHALIKWTWWLTLILLSVCVSHSMETGNVDGNLFTSFASRLNDIDNCFLAAHQLLKDFTAWPLPLSLYFKTGNQKENWAAVDFECWQVKSRHIKAASFFQQLFINMLRWNHEKETNIINQVIVSVITRRQKAATQQMMMKCLIYIHSLSHWPCLAHKALRVQFKM